VFEKSTNLRAAAAFCDSDLAVNPLTLKLEGDEHILKMYPESKDEVASSKHSKLRACSEKKRNFVLMPKVKVRMPKAPNYFERYRNSYTDQAPTVSLVFLVACYRF